MAYQGAKVIHPRAVEIAMQAKIPLRVRSTYSDSLGTLVTSSIRSKKGSDVKERLVTGITYVSNLTQIKVQAKEGNYELQSDVFKAMANEEISVDFINISPNGVVYTVSGEMTERAVAALRRIGYEPIVTTGCAKVSTVGAGIAGVPGVTAKIVTAFRNKEFKFCNRPIVIRQFGYLVKEADMIEAVNALHNAFHLSETGGNAID